MCASSSIGVVPGMIEATLITYRKISALISLYDLLIIPLYK